MRRFSLPSVFCPLSLNEDWAFAKIANALTEVLCHVSSFMFHVS